MQERSLPVTLGGTPVFSTPLPMARPKLPDPSVVLPHFETIIRSGSLTKGTFLQEFENASSQYLSVEHCLGVSSCTSGLMLCLQAHRRRLTVGQSLKVIVPSFTFLAGISAILWAGLEPVFVDVDPTTMNLCLKDLKRCLETVDASCVVAVHCFGNPVVNKALEALCQEANVRLIYDAAHGFGSIHEGKKVGHGGWCQVYSLTPTKMVVAGEGGLVVTGDPELAKEIETGREYGNDGSYDTVFPGLNARMSEFHAALALESLKLLEDLVAHRNVMAQKLMGALGSIPGIGFQTITENSRSTYKDFTMTINADIFGSDRDSTANALTAEGVPSRKYFSPPCHLHHAFKKYLSRPLPQTELLASRCLSIPVLELDTVEGIAEAFEKIHQHGAHKKRTPVA